MNPQVWLYIGLGAAAVTVLWLAVFLLRKRAKRREMRRKVDDKLREEALDRRLVGGRRGSPGVSAIPFDVRYDQSQRRKKQQQAQSVRPSIMVQLTERSDLSTRNYIFNISDRLTFGSQSPPCDIAVAGFDGGCCEIFRIHSDLYIKSCGTPDSVRLKRKRTQTLVGQKGIQLENHDSLLMGECIYEITLFKNSR